MTAQERARRYVATLPIAVSGNRGHDALFLTACVLAHGFKLSDDEAWPLLIEYNARCLPPWSERDLKHKLADARKVPHRLPAGHLLRGCSAAPKPSARAWRHQATGT
jgi:hypothetical protein